MNVIEHIFWLIALTALIFFATISVLALSWVLNEPTVQHLGTLIIAGGVTGMLALAVRE